MFEQLPKSKNADGLLTITELFEHGRTVTYSELPERLWSTTGVRLAKAADFIEFGKLRNKIIHFAVPNVDLPSEVLRFVFEIMEPMMDAFWGESVVPYAEEWDEVIASDGYLGEQVSRLGITVAPKTAVLLGLEDE